MASREVDGLVDRIRLQRQRVSHAWRHCTPLHGVQRSIDRHPMGWLVGGAAVGFVMLPLVGSLVLALPRRLARLWLRTTVQGGVLHIAQGALVDLWNGRRHATADPDAARSVWQGSSLPPEEPPLQASGGPVRPARTS
jgi:hypothetical protein